MAARHADVSGAPGWRVRLVGSRPVLLAQLVNGAAFLACYVSTFQTKPLFAPDTRYYAAMTLWYAGGDQAAVAEQVREHSALSGWASPGPDQLFGWGLVQPRVVLPALSVPFVRLWGIEGMVVVPGLALAALVVLLTTMLARRYGVGAAIGTVLLLVVSTQVMFFGAAMLTESLSALWTALTLLVAWRYVRDPTWLRLALMVALTVVSAFTRQATFIVAGAFVCAWLLGWALRRPERWGRPAVAVAVTAVGCQLLQTWLFPTFSQKNQYFMKTGADSLGEALRNTPDLAWMIIKVDVTQAAGADRAILVVVLLSLVSMVVLWRRPESHLLLGCLLGAGLYNITNGTPTGIRYAMPGLVFFACSVAVLFAAAAGRPEERVEAQEPVPDALPESRTDDETRDGLDDRVDDGSHQGAVAPTRA
jgi:hypothetical protein